MATVSRDWRLDLIRTIAFADVVLVHYLMNSEFYDFPCIGIRMAAMVLLRSATIICVPLFMILTGYLVKGSISKKFYRKLLPIAITYIIASIMCKLYSWIYLKRELSIIGLFWDLTGFSAAPYAWYVEMYIGLFLLIPFLSMLWDMLDKRQRCILLVTVFFLFFAPNILNKFNLSGFGWWIDPQSSDSMTKVLPAWWGAAYPIGYYFIGRWLKDYGCSLTRWQCGLLFFGSCGFLAAFDWWRSHGYTYIREGWNTYNSPIVLIATIMLFCFVMTLKDCPQRAKNTLEVISRLSFGAYLTSWIWDDLFYTKLNETVPDIPLRLNWLPVIVIGIFVCSLITSWIVERVTKRILQTINQVRLECADKRVAQNAIKLRWIPLALIAAASFFILWKCPYGFGNIDESFYLTIPLRLCMGDSLVGQEWHLSLFSSVFLVLPMKLQLMIWGGTEEVILHFRYLYSLVWIASTLFIFARLRSITRWGALAASLIFLLYAPFGIMALSYNSLGILFLTLCSTILFTIQDDAHQTLWLLIAGILLGCSVLCCPYLVILWFVGFIYVCIRALICHVAPHPFAPREFLLFTSGAIVVGVVLMAYLVAVVGIAPILQSIPLMLSDPEHPSLSLTTKISQYVSSVHSCSTLAIPVIVLAVVAGLVGRRKPHFCGPMIAVVCVSSFILQMSYVPPYINYIMFPLSIVGITIRLFGWSKTANTAFRTMWLPGFIYGFCIHMSSNQNFYAISSAMTVSAVAAVCMLCTTYSKCIGMDGSATHRKPLEWMAAGIVGLVVLLQISLLFDLRYASVFWEDDMSAQTCLATEGPEKGILMTEEKLDTYNSHLQDVQELVSMSPNGAMLNFSPNTWMYLIAPYENASYSAWISGLSDASIQRLEAYYQLNPNKQPTIVYLENPGDERRVADLIGDYQPFEFDSGRCALISDGILSNQETYTTEIRGEKDA